MGKCKVQFVALHCIVTVAYHLSDSWKIILLSKFFLLHYIHWVSLWRRGTKRTGTKNYSLCSAGLSVFPFSSLLATSCAAHSNTQIYACWRTKRTTWNAEKRRRTIETQIRSLHSFMHTSKSLVVGKHLEFQESIST